MNEEQLVQALRGAEEQAFRYLVDRYKHSVYNTVLGFVQDTAVAEELTQDVFIQVYERIGSFRQEAQLGTWIYRISVYQALGHLRKARQKKRFGFFSSLLGADNEPLHQPADFHHPGVVLEKKEQAALLFKAIDRLPENQKTAFLLQKVQDCSQKQVAEIMQLNEGAVESLLGRARTNLKKMLIHYYTS